MRRFRSGGAMRRKILLAAFDDTESVELVARALLRLGFTALGSAAISNDIGIYQREFPIYLEVREPRSNGDSDSLIALTNGEHLSPVFDEFVDGGVSGAAVGGTVGLLMGVAAIAFPEILPAYATSALVPTATGLTIGTMLGGLAGLLRGVELPEFNIARYAELADRGAKLLAVHCSSLEWLRIAQSVFSDTETENITACTEEEFEILKEISRIIPPLYGTDGDRSEGAESQVRL